MTHQEVRDLTGEIMWRKRIEIEDHVTEIKIKNFETIKNQTYTQSCMSVTGMCDGKPYSFKTDGKYTIGKIVEEIIKQTR